MCLDVWIQVALACTLATIISGVSRPASPLQACGLGGRVARFLAKLVQVVLKRTQRIGAGIRNLVEGSDGDDEEEHAKHGSRRQ